MVYYWDCERALADLGLVSKQSLLWQPSAFRQARSRRYPTAQFRRSIAYATRPTGAPASGIIKVTNQRRRSTHGVP
jgi:hypothetical protein